MRDDSTPLDTHELAWAAGFFDGEGSTCISSYKPNNQNAMANVLTMTISQIHRETLERFQRAIGGVGVINGPYNPPSFGKNQQPQYRYHLSGLSRVVPAIDSLWPWLGRIKREQASAAIDLMRERQRPVGHPTQELCNRGHDYGVVGTKTRSGKRVCARCEQLVSLAAYYRRKGDPEEAQRVLDETHISRKSWRSAASLT